MKNKIKSKSLAMINLQMYNKISEGWKVISQIKKHAKFWEVVIEKNENFTEDAQSFGDNIMKNQKKEKRNVILAAILMFVALFTMIIFALSKSGAI